MKINRNSWHYKVSNLFTEWESSSDTLCWYFWRLVFTLLGISTIICIIALLIYSYFTSPQWQANSIAVLSISLSIVLPILAIRKLRQINGKPYKLSGEDVVVEFIKAKKNKICPLITYTDND